jgi:CRISPR/Cas system-associated exonuclease Cas4 (RecB family)
MPMPGVFSAINTRIQGNLIGKNLNNLGTQLPSGIVETQEGWVESKMVPETDVYIKGKYDILVKREDGSYIIVDLKISQPNEEKIDKYKSQLFSYKFALENPKNGVPIKITKMGLLIFYPDQIKFDEGDVSLTFPPKWLDIPEDEKSFFGFMKEIDLLLKGSRPAESKTCKWCSYRHLGEELSHMDAIPVQEDIPF